MDMHEKRRRLVEDINVLAHRMQEISDAADKAGEWSQEQRENFDQASARTSELEATLQTVEADIDRASRARAFDDVDRRQIVDTAGGQVETPESRQARQTEEYREAFETYMRGGLEDCTREQKQLLRENFVRDSESRAQGVGTNSAGGYTVPPGFRAVMQETMKAYGGLLNLANVITTSTGNPLQWPTNDDTGNVGAILAENTQIAQQDVTFGTRTLGAYKYTSKLVLVSWELLQDSAFDINTWLPKKLGERIGRAVAAHLITGTGTGQPTGITTGVTVGKTGATGQTATVIYDDLVDLEHSIDPAYRTSRVRYVMNDSTLRVIRKLKDTQGRPLWVPVPTVGMAATINGVPYTIDQGMPAMAANAYSILYGDFEAGMIVRQVHDVQLIRLQERYADFLQTGYFAFTRLDAKPDDPNAVAAYRNSAT